MAFCIPIEPTFSWKAVLSKSQLKRILKKKKVLQSIGGLISSSNTHFLIP